MDQTAASDAVAIAATTATSDGNGVGMLLVILACYLIPTFIALKRKHQQTGPIIALNLLLGWTVIGWVGAFIWSLTSPQKPQTIVVYAPPPPPTPSAEN